MNLNNMTKMLKCAGNDDIVTMKAEDNGDVVTFLFENKGKQQCDASGVYQATKVGSMCPCFVRSVPSCERI